MCVCMHICIYQRSGIQLHHSSLCHFRNFLSIIQSISIAIGRPIFLFPLRHRNTVFKSYFFINIVTNPLNLSFLYQFHQNSLFYAMYQNYALIFDAF